MPPDARLSRDHRFNIASRPKSSDLLLMNAGLAKPILWYLVYSKADQVDVAQDQVRALRANHGLFRRKSPAIPDRAYAPDAIAAHNFEVRLSFRTRLLRQFDQRLA